jgi:hypothetical protein
MFQLDYKMPMIQTSYDTTVPFLILGFPNGRGFSDVGSTPCTTLGK